MGKKTETGAVFEIAPGRYAFGEPGKPAIQTVQKFKTGGVYVGVRGIKPIIPLDAKQKDNVPQQALSVLARLTGQAKRDRSKG